MAGYGYEYGSNMNDQIGGNFTGDGFFSQENSTNFHSTTGNTESRKVSRESQTLTPVTIKQLKSAEQPSLAEPFRINGVQIHQVKIVGYIVDKVSNNAKTIYTIQDCSDQIQVYEWLNKKESLFEQEQQAQCSPDTYVTVYGMLQYNDDQLSLQKHRMRPVQDFNEITHHFLECIYVYLHNTRGPLQLQQQQTNELSSTTSINSPYLPQSQRNQTPTMFNQYQQNQSLQRHQISMLSNTNMYQNNISSGLSLIQAKVLDCFRDDNGNEEGVMVQTVIDKLSRQFPVDQILEAINFLSVEGHIYATVDDKFYKVTVA